jgi:hypothetical protein
MEALMRIALLLLGLAAAAVGAVFIGIGIWQFAAGEIRSIFAVSLWIWIGLHALFAFVSLIFFRLYHDFPTHGEPNPASEKLI